jgi:hypothetical protein
MNLRIVLFPFSHVIVEYGVTVISMPPEQFKRLILHPNNQLQGITWIDAHELVNIGNDVHHVCSQEIADALGNYPLEVERIYKRCFQNIAPELYGAEIKGVRIQVYQPSTQEAE